MVNEKQQIQVTLVEENESWNVKIGKALKLERIRNGKTQSDIGKIINVTFQQIQKYEKAKNSISEFKSRKIVKSFGKDYEQFLREYNVYTS